MIFKVRLQEKKLRTLPNGETVPMIVRDWEEELEAETKQKARKAARKKYPHAARYQIGQVWKKK